MDIKSSSLMVKADSPKVAEILNFHTSYFASFQKDWELAKDMVNLLYDEHWSQEDKDKHTVEGRQALNMPMQFSQMLSLLGFEIQNTTEIILEPEGKEDELTAEVGTVQIKHIQTKSHFQELRSDAFFSAMCPMYGVYKIVEKENDAGEIETMIEGVPYNRVIFDKNNYTQYDLSDCYRFQEFEYVYPEDLELEYELTEKDFENLGDETFTSDNSADLVEKDSFLTEQVTLVNGKQVVKRLIKKIHDYKKINKRIYEVHKIVDLSKTLQLPPEQVEDWMMPGIVQFETQQEADIYITENFNKVLQYSSGVATEVENFFIKKPKVVRRLQYTCIAGHKELYSHDLKTKNFKHVIVFGIFHLGKWWTPFKIGKDLQTYFDRTISQLDYSIGTDIKTSFDIVTTLVDDASNTKEQFSEALSLGKNTFALGHGAVTPNPRAGANPEYFKILDVTRDLSSDMYAGKVMQGLQEYSQQSGKAIEKLQIAGAILNLNYLKNLTLSDKILGERLVESIQQNYDRKLILKVNGGELNERVKQVLIDNKMYQESSTKEGLAWVLYNPNDLPPEQRPLSDASFEVSVGRVSARQDEAEVLFTKLLNFAKITGVMPPAEMFADAMGFTATQKSMLIKAVAEHNQKLEQQQQVQQQQMIAEGSLKAMTESGKILNQQRAIEVQEAQLNQNNNNSK